ncbi:response regulator transcription factor [Saccharothrix sp. NRRL B-16348]|uniref:response regulator transcription factor n=1 Tax=Saccharothrix sp. NRRL B-16348 TaxID=1415542 RepID=UPI0006AFB606|nr:response regulator transcription factor [Saccharothrix sp. NRRL B-16348]
MNINPLSPVPITGESERQIIIYTKNLPFRAGLASVLEVGSNLSVIGAYDTVESASAASDELPSSTVLVDAGPQESDARQVADQVMSHFHDSRGRVVVLIGALDLPATVDLMRSGVRAVIRREGPLESFHAAVRAVHQGDALVAGGVLDAILEKLPDPLPAQAEGIPAFESLTNSERALFAMVVEGLSNVEIARRRSISVRTVKYHISNVMRKLDLHGRAEIIALAYRTGHTPDRWTAKIQPGSTVGNE